MDLMTLFTCADACTTPIGWSLNMILPCLSAASSVGIKFDIIGIIGLTLLCRRHLSV